MIAKFHEPLNLQGKRPGERSREKAISNDCSKGPQPFPLSLRVPALSLALPALAIAAALVIWRPWTAYSKTEPELILPGIVECQEIRLASKVGGRVDEVCALQGTIVEQGRVLVRLEVPELAAQRSQLIALKAMVEAKLEMAENGPLHEQIESAQALVDMAEAKLAELKAGHRPEELAQAALEVKVRASEQARAQREFDRMQKLASSNSVSRSEFDASRSIRDAAAGELEMARQRLNLLQAGTRAEIITEAQAQLRKAKADLKLLMRGTRAEELNHLRAQLAEAEARIQLVDVQMAEAEVTAPANCLVEVLPVRKGDVVLPNQPVARVRVPDDLWINAYLPETELGRVRLNQSVEVSHDGNGSRYEGSIDFIASASEFTPRNIQSVSERQHQVFAMKIRVKNAAGVFKSGMAAQVRVKVN